MRPTVSSLSLIEGPRFDSRAVEWFYRLLGLALLWLVAADVQDQRWQSQAGLLFQQRLPLGGLLPQAWLALEWGLLTLCALGIIFDKRRVAAVRLACVVCGVSLWQAYMNQRVLLFINLAYLSLRPPDPKEPGFESHPQQNLALIRWQVVIVYLFTALGKLRWGFADGRTLSALFANISAMRSQPMIHPSFYLSAFQAHPGLPQALSILVIALELVLPALLLWRPRAGIAAAALFHAGMALSMPELWAFTLAMTADCLLFLG